MDLFLPKIAMLQFCKEHCKVTILAVLRLLNGGVASLRVIQFPIWDSPIPLGEFLCASINAQPRLLVSILILQESMGYADTALHGNILTARCKPDVFSSFYCAYLVFLSAIMHFHKKHVLVNLINSVWGWYIRLVFETGSAKTSYFASYIFDIRSESDWNSFFHKVKKEALVGHATDTILSSSSSHTNMLFTRNIYFYSHNPRCPILLSLESTPSWRHYFYLHSIFLKVKLLETVWFPVAKSDAWRLMETCAGIAAAVWARAKCQRNVWVLVSLWLAGSRKQTSSRWEPNKEYVRAEA